MSQKAVVLTVFLIGIVVVAPLAYGISSVLCRPLLDPSQLPIWQAHHPLCALQAFNPSAR